MVQNSSQAGVQSISSNGQATVSISPGVEAALYAGLYEAVLDILGTTGTIISFEDPLHKVSSSVFSTVGDIQANFTWNEPPGDFDNGTSRKGLINVINFKGAVESAFAPDNDYWSLTGGSPDSPVSMGYWINNTDNTASHRLLAKSDRGSSGVGTEWEFGTSLGKPILALFDNSETVSATSTARLIRKYDDSAISQDTWVFVAGTYNGDGTITGIKLYVDGVEATTYDTDNVGTYVAMENTAQVVYIGKHRSGGADIATSFIEGAIAGGPIAPFFTKKELSADEVLRLYEIGRRALDLS